MSDDLIRRENVPDPEQVADWVVRDVANPDKDQGFLDAVGTLTGLAEDDLVAVVIELAWRVNAALGDKT